MTTPINTAILVSSTAGVVSRQFCSADYARSFVDNPANRGCSAFFCEDGLSAEDVLVLAPDFRNRVEESENRLRQALRIKAVLDKYEVTEDGAVRQAIHRAFAEVCYERVRARLASIGGYSMQQETQAQAADSAARLVETALDHCAVPAEDQLRQSVKKAFQELLDN